MLPDIKISLPVLFLLWCVSAWIAFDGYVMLIYPAIWAVVGAMFFAVDRALTAQRPAVADPASSAHGTESSA